MQETKAGYLYCIPVGYRPRDIGTASEWSKDNTQLHVKLGSVRGTDPVKIIKEAYSRPMGQPEIWWLEGSARAYHDEMNLLPVALASHRVWQNHEIFVFRDKEHCVSTLQRFSGAFRFRTAGVDKPPIITDLVNPQPVHRGTEDRVYGEIQLPDESRAEEADDFTEAKEDVVVDGIHAFQDPKAALGTLLMIAREDATAEEVNDMFRIFIADQESILTRIDNVRVEMAEYKVDALEFATEHALYRERRAAVIKQLCDLLGLRSSFGLGQEVSRERVAGAVDSILGKTDALKDVFGLRIRSSAADAGCQQAIALVNQCFRKWGFTELKCGVHKRRRQGGNADRVETTSYIVQEQAAFKGYGSRVCMLRCPK